jgi:hypothetical protein
VLALSPGADLVAVEHGGELPAVGDATDQVALGCHAGDLEAAGPPTIEVVADLDRGTAIEQSQGMLGHLDTSRTG